MYNTTPPRPLCYHLFITQRSNLAGGRCSRAGRAPVVAGRLGEGALLGGLGGVVCGGGLAAGGHPLHGGAAGVDADVPVCGLRRSTVTACCCPPMSMLKYFGPLLITLYGPL